MGSLLLSESAAPAAVPRGARFAPRGEARWYPLEVPLGRERALCEDLRALVRGDVLEDAFALSKERWSKRGGLWRIELSQMYRGYAFAVTRDARGLDRALSRLSLPVRVAGAGALRPLAPEVQGWLSDAMDSDCVLRSSTASIVGGKLRVSSGPLVGQEARVSKIDRHRRRCRVQVRCSDGTEFSEIMPLDVPFKS